MLTREACNECVTDCVSLQIGACLFNFVRNACRPAIRRVTALDVDNDVVSAPRSEPAADYCLGFAVAVDVGDVECAAASVIEPIEQPPSVPLLGQVRGSKDQAQRSHRSEECSARSNVGRARRRFRHLA